MFTSRTYRNHKASDNVTANETGRQVAMVCRKNGQPNLKDKINNEERKGIITKMMTKSLSAGG